MPISPFLKQHWRIILICSAIALIVVVTVIVCVVVLVVNKPTTSPPFQSNVPPGINGPASNGGDGVFAFPQFVTNPTNDLVGFGEMTFVHPAGYVCVVAETTAGVQSLLFYYTDIRGAIQGPQRIDLPFLTPTVTRVCNGAFAPIFNVINEVYYFFLTVGTWVKDSNNVTTLFAHHVVLFSLNTAVTATEWSVSDIQSPYTANLQYGNSQTVKALRIPINSFTPDPSRPWIGTFGDNIQVILDDTFTNSLPKQSLYLSGSMYNINQPGGSLYWFYLADNTTSPQIIFKNQIQDAKLLLLQDLPPSDLSPGCTPFSSSDINAIPQSTFMNSFGSSFFVTSGLGAQNVLLIGNVTGEDYCSIIGSEQPAAPNGYVQGFTFDQNTGEGIWKQNITSNRSFQYRYIPEGDNTLQGFGYTCAWFNNFVIIGTSASPLLPNKQVNFPVYKWDKNPVQNNKIMDRTTTLAPTAPFTQSNLYPVSAPADINLRYNMKLFDSSDGNDLIVTVWNSDTEQNVVSVQNPASQGTPPYASYSTIQNLGGDISTATPDTSSFLHYPLTRTGFGQGTDTWTSRTGLNVRLLINDPNFNNGLGRFVVYSKNL